MGTDHPLTNDRLPTPDELAGMTWWNALTETQRGHWLEQAASAVPADAWASFKAQGQVVTHRTRAD